LNTTAIPGFLKYLGLVVEKKNGFQVVENSQKNGFRKTRVGNTSGYEKIAMQRKTSDLLCIAMFNN